MESYIMECPRCGMTTEVSVDRISYDNPAVRCSRCGVEWVVEVSREDYWLEPMYEAR